MENQKQVTEIQLVTKYIDSLLETGKQPSSIYVFSKSFEIDEADFYAFFSSFEQLEKRIFKMFFENALTVLEKNDDYKTYEAKNKLLSLYFTYIEILTQNRSYVIQALNTDKNGLQNLKKLDSLKKIFGLFIDELQIEKIDFNQEKIEKFQNKAIKNVFWAQFLILIKFWIDDTSSSFEKTDIFIEKNVQASFDLIQTQPLKSLLDLGKFFLKEKMDLKF
uniref:TetR family transcriptional regulator C-terminal domain-containing protein n=1 Tax=Polaribacter sp. TaxID=1920175 RepID=UPI004047607F